jgi:hypothetical protein
MADKKITELSNVDTADADSLLMIVTGPDSGSPANKKISLENAPVIAPSFTVANIPTSGIATGQLIYVTNAATPGLAVCTDGATNAWVMTADGNVPAT